MVTKTIDKVVASNKSKPSSLVLPSQCIRLHRSRAGRVRPDFDPSPNVKHWQIDSIPSLLDQKRHRINIFRPKHLTQGLLPTIFMIQGTGFVADCDWKVTHAVCSQLANRTGCQVINLSHRLSPEYLHPLPIIELSQQINSLFKTKMSAIDQDQCFGVGYSSGGYFMGWMAAMGLLSSQFYLFPLIDLSMTQVPEQNIDALSPGKDAMPTPLLDDMRGCYSGISLTNDAAINSLRKHSPLPLLKKNLEYKCVMTGDEDQLAASTIHFAENVPNSDLIVYPGCNHFSPLQNPHIIVDCAARIEQHMKDR